MEQPTIAEVNKVASGRISCMQKDFLSSLPDHKRQGMILIGVNITFPLLFPSVHKPADLPRNSVFHSFTIISINPRKCEIALNEITKFQYVQNI